MKLLRIIFFTLVIILTTSISEPINKNSHEFKLYEKKGLYFVRLTLNGYIGNFLLDTGATISIIDINQSKNYKFKYHTTNSELSGIGGSLIKYRITNTMVSDRDYILNIKFSGIDLKPVISDLRKRNMHVIGIIGGDYLTHCSAVINYKEKTLTIY